jgi:hypothetical protein
VASEASFTSAVPRGERSEFYFGGAAWRAKRVLRGVPGRTLPRLIFRRRGKRSGHRLTIILARIIAPAFSPWRKRNRSLPLVTRHFVCVPGRTRTCSLLVRSQTLYPLSYGHIYSFVSRNVVSVNGETKNGARAPFSESKPSQGRPLGIEPRFLVPQTNVLTIERWSPL